MVLSNKSNNCLVIGSTGFVGSRVGAVIQSRGFVVHRFLREGKSDAEGLVFYGDRNGDFPVESLVEYLRARRISSVAHFGNVFERMPTAKVAENMLYANFLVPAKILVAAIEAGVGTFVNLGSGWQLDSSKFAEAPDYISSKEAFRDFLGRYSERIRTASVFVNEIFGRGDNRNKLISQALEAARIGKLLQVGSSMQELGFTSVDRLGSEVADFLDGVARPSEYLYQNYSNVTIEDLLQAIGRSSGKLLWEARSREYIPLPKLTVEVVGELPFERFEAELASLVDIAKS